MIMRKTKVTFRNNHHVLMVEDQYGKYKQIYKSLKKSDVNRKRAEVRAESIDVQSELAARTFVDVYEEFANYKVEQAKHPLSGIRLSSVDCYQSWFRKWIKPFFPKNVLVKELTAPVLDSYFLKLYREEGATWLTANLVLKSFLTCMKYAVENQYINEVGIMLFYKPRKRPQLKPQLLSEMKRKKTVMINREEVRRLLNHLTPKDNNVKDWLRFTCITTLAFTGLRMSELRALRWDRINFTTQKIMIDKSIVEGVMKNTVKAEGSEGAIQVHPALMKVLMMWKSIQSKHFTPNKIALLFNTLKNVSPAIPISERTINDWLKLAFHDLGLAKVDVVKNISGNSKHYLKVHWCKFKGCISRTFRHFSSTSLLDAQNSNPVLTDNFIKSQIRHKDIRTTRGIYGDHNDLDTTDAMHNAQTKALENAYPNLIDTEKLQN